MPVYPFKYTFEPDFFTKSCIFCNEFLIPFLQFAYFIYPLSELVPQNCVPSLVHQFQHFYTFAE